MKTTEKQVTLRTLKAEQGYILAQNKEVELKDRVFSEVVFLAANADENDWMEIPIEQANELKQQQKDLFKNDI